LLAEELHGRFEFGGLMAVLIVLNLVALMAALTLALPPQALLFS
jgi:hypothetical protein